MILFAEHLLMTKNNIKKKSVCGVKIFFKYFPPLPICGNFSTNLPANNTSPNFTTNTYN